MSTDVLIVGAGPAGVTAAGRLSAAGVRVTCLEQGDWHQPGDGAAGTAVEASSNPNRRRSPADVPIDDSESDIAPLMWNGVGGSSITYAAQWTRHLPADFRVRTLDGVADDWPFTYEELEPYYERVERQFGVSGHPGDPAYPATNAPPLPAADIRASGRKIAKAHNELGWHWWPGANAIATRRYQGRGPCTQLGLCRWICPVQAKTTVDVTHWPEAMRSGTQLVTGARAQSIELDSRGRATGVVYTDRSGEEHFHEASVVMLAGNGIGTSRLLLLSGIANSSGLVGRRLMMHPYATVAGIFDEQLESWQGVWGQLITSLQFYESDPSRGFVRGAKWGLAPTGPPEASVSPYPWGYGEIWGQDFHHQVGRRFGHSAVWGIVGEDLPSEDNCVELHPDRTDATGRSIPKIRYRTSENTDRLLAFHTRKAEESLRAAGATDLVVGPLLRESGWHLLGTAKMGDDPATSVVDGWGRSHDVPNLFIVDGSVFPTSAGMNPTATVAAFSLRSAEHLLRERLNQDVPA
jgi:choline dehydrogenase-like flavoprotein